MRLTVLLTQATVRVQSGATERQAGNPPPVCGWHSRAGWPKTPRPCPMRAVRLAATRSVGTRIIGAGPTTPIHAKTPPDPLQSGHSSATCPPPVMSPIGPRRPQVSPKNLTLEAPGSLRRQPPGVKPAWHPDLFRAPCLLKEKGQISLPKRKNTPTFKAYPRLRVASVRSPTTLRPLRGQRPCPPRSRPSNASSCTKPATYPIYHRHLNWPKQILNQGPPPPLQPDPSKASTTATPNPTAHQPDHQSPTTRKCPKPTPNLT